MAGMLGMATRAQLVSLRELLKEKYMDELRYSPEECQQVKETISQIDLRINSH